MNYTVCLSLIFLFLDLPALTTIKFGSGAFTNTPSLVLDSMSYNYRHDNLDLPSLQSIVFGASSFGGNEGSLILESNISYCVIIY